MLLATMLLLMPFPATADTSKAATETPTVTTSAATATAESSKDTDAGQPLPLFPEAKVVTDLMAAQDAAEGYAADSRYSESVAIQPGTPPYQTHPYETARQRKMWYALSISGSGAAAFDAWSTRRVISGGYGTESNPLLRPFVHSSALYAATQASPLLLDYVGKRMMLSQHHWMRKMWWVPQAAGTAMSLTAGIHNTTLVP